MQPNPLVEQIFSILAKLTGPLKGYRTLVGTVGGIALLVYAAMNGNYEMAAMAGALLMSNLGLRPDPPPPEA